MKQKFIDNRHPARGQKMVYSCTGESNILTFKRAKMKEILKLTPSSITCKKASSFPLRKEEDVALDETKEDGDLKSKPTITGDELYITFKPSL